MGENIRTEVSQGKLEPTGLVSNGDLCCDESIGWQSAVASHDDGRHFVMYRYTKLLQVVARGGLGRGVGEWVGGLYCCEVKHWQWEELKSEREKRKKKKGRERGRGREEGWGRRRE